MAEANRQVIDKQWFFDQLEGQRKSVRALARHLEVDPSAVSRMFSGQRRMKMEEANAIARFLNAPVSEVLAHAGITMEPVVSSRVVLAATINGKGEVHRLQDAKPLPQQVIDRAHAAIGMGNNRVIAAQVRADGGALAMWDDAVILFNATDIVEPSAIGVISICRLREGTQIMAKIERARKTGEALVRGPDNSTKEVQLDTATPVLAIIP